MSKTSKSKIIRECFRKDETLLELPSKAAAKRIGRGVTYQLVDNQKRMWRLNGKAAPITVGKAKPEPKVVVESAALKSGEEFYCEIQIPTAGATIKLSTKSRGMVGTLSVTGNGFTFVKANAKKPTGRTLSWELLTKLFESGLLQ